MKIQLGSQVCLSNKLYEHGPIFRSSVLGQSLLCTHELPSTSICSVCVNGSTEGDCKEDLCRMRLVDLYALQGVDLGEGGSFSYWCDTVKQLA